jgi:hypothetical protein
MKAVIDTNILYYISGVSETIYDRKKLLSNLNYYDHWCVSELGILEMLAKFADQKYIIVSIINFLHDENIEINPILEKKYSICNENINNALSHDIKFLNFLTVEALRVKKHLENSYLRMLIISIAIVYLNLAFYKDKFSDIKYQQFIDNFMLLSIGIDDEKSICKIEIENALEDFYKTQDQCMFKDRIIEIVADICETYLLFVEVESKGINFRDFIGQYDIKNEVYSEIEIIHANNKLTRNISNRKIQKAKIVGNYSKEELEITLSRLKASLSNILPQGEIVYISELIKKILEHKDSKIEKNDIIDSMYFKYVPEYHLITCDEYMRKIISLCNVDNGKAINSILERSIRS